MFGIGVPELMLILAIALIVLGPDKLPQLAKQIAKFVGELKRASEEFKQQLDVDGIDEIKELKEVANIRNPETWKKNLDRLIGDDAEPHAPPEHIAGASPDTEKSDLPGGLGSDWKIASGSQRGEEERSKRVIDDVVNPQIDPSVYEKLSGTAEKSSEKTEGIEQGESQGEEAGGQPASSGNDNEGKASSPGT